MSNIEKLETRLSPASVALNLWTVAVDAVLALVHGTDRQRIISAALGRNYMRPEGREIDIDLATEEI